jgi:hypothetical protein
LERQPARWLLLSGVGFCLYLSAAGVDAMNMVVWRTAVVGRTTVYVWLASSLALWLAIWIITRVTVAEPTKSRWLRLVTRVAMTVWIIAIMLCVGRYVLWPPGQLTFYYGYEFQLRSCSAAISTVLFFAYASHLAIRMRATWLTWTCRGLSALSITMLWPGFLAYLFPRVSLGMALPSPTIPILGNVWETTYVIWQQGVFWWVQSLSIEWFDDLWAVSATAIMLIFATLLLNLAAGHSRRTAASSRP